MKKDDTKVAMQHSKPSGKSILNPFSGMSIDFELRDMEVEGTFTHAKKVLTIQGGLRLGESKDSHSSGMHYTP